MRMITSARMSTWRWQTAYASILFAILELIRTEKGFALTIRREVSAGFITPTRSAAAFLARTYSHTKNESYFALAQKAMQYTAQYQRADGSWYYAEKADAHWVDNFHTGYVLDCFKHYAESTADHRFDQNLKNGYEFWKKTFFLPDGTPRYYDSKTLPLDIQCSSQAIDTLVFFSDRIPKPYRWRRRSRGGRLRTCRISRATFIIVGIHDGSSIKLPRCIGGRRLCFARSEDSTNGSALQRGLCEKKNSHYC